MVTAMPEHVQSDLGTAAFLVVRGFRLLGLAQDGRGRFQFRFDDSDDRAANAALGYLQGESVPARALIAAEKDLKTLLYSMNGNGHGYHKHR
jgi:hypothetical protein